MDPLQQLIGIKLTHLLAGIAGGIVRAFLSGDPNVWSAIASVVVGSLTAGYMTSPVYIISQRYFGFVADTSTEHAVGFLVGLTAMMLCEGVLRFAKQWSRNPTMPPGAS